MIALESKLSGWILSQHVDFLDFASLWFWIFWIGVKHNFQSESNIRGSERDYGHMIAIPAIFHETDFCHVISNN